MKLRRGKNGINDRWRRKIHQIRMALGLWRLHRRLDYLGWKMAWTSYFGHKPLRRLQL